MSQVVVTGATGFIGSSVVRALSAQGHDVIALTRKKDPGDVTDAKITWRPVANYKDDPNLADILKGADALIMLADQAARDTQHNNSRPTDDAKSLAALAQAAGVTRLIYSSSIYARMAAEGTHIGYGTHKLASERGITEVTQSAAVFLRLPPVYGLKGRGGFQILCKLVAKLPILPFGRASAKRSYIHVENVADLCVVLTGLSDDQWTNVRGKAYEPSDGPPVETRRLISEIGKAMGRAPLQLPIPLAALRALGRVTGKADAISGAIDPLHTRQTPSLEHDVGWGPKTTFPDTLAYLSSQA